MLSITVPGGVGTSGDRLLLAVTEDAISTVVTRGENSGHTLSHVNVTRRLVPNFGTLGTNAFHYDLPNVQADPAWHAKALHAVVLVQRGDGGAIVAAGTIAFPNAR